MKTIVNHYYKDSGKRPHPGYMSGLPLPLDPDGVCRNHRFERCEFHFECASAKFENCEFIHCNPHGPMTNYTNCKFEFTDGWTVTLKT